MGLTQLPSMGVGGPYDPLLPKLPEDPPPAPEEEDCCAPELSHEHSASTWQLKEQQSPFVRLPSSHCSVPSTQPLPQKGAALLAVDELFANDELLPDDALLLLVPPDDDCADDDCPDDDEVPV